LPMADRFDVVAIRIEDEGPRVGLMVLGAKTGTTVVAPDRRYGCLVESPTVSHGRRRPHLPQPLGPNRYLSDQLSL
jgi:hypothetical protein